MADFVERRRMKRGTKFLRFEYSLRGVTVNALSSNVSSCGAFLCANELPESGENVDIRFRLGTDSSRTVTIRSRVMRVVRETDDEQRNRGFAVHWIQAGTPGDPEVLDDFLGQLPGDTPGDVQPAPAGTLDFRFIYPFPFPPEIVDETPAPAPERAPIAMGPGDSMQQELPEGLSISDLFHEDDFDDDDDDGPATEPVMVAGGNELDALFGEGADDPLATIPPEAMSALDDSPAPIELELPPSPPPEPMPTPAPVTASVSQPTPPAAQPAVAPAVEAPALPASASRPMRAVEQGQVDDTRKPTPPRGMPAQPQPETPRYVEPDPADDDVGSGLLPADIPVQLQWGSEVATATTLYVTETEIRLVMEAAPPSAYTRVAVVFPPKKKKKNPQCILWTNVTRVRKGAAGTVGARLTMRLAMQNEPSDLRAYRKILKKVKKEQRR